MAILSAKSVLAKSRLIIWHDICTFFSKVWHVYPPCSKTHRASLTFIVSPSLYVGFMRRQMEEKHERRVFIVDVCKLALLSRRIFLPTVVPRHFPPRFFAASDTREYPTRTGITRRNYGTLHSTFSYSAILPQVRRIVHPRNPTKTRSYYSIWKRFRKILPRKRKLENLPKFEIKIESFSLLNEQFQ